MYILCMCVYIYIYMYVYIYIYAYTCEPEVHSHCCSSSPWKLETLCNISPSQAQNSAGDIITVAFPKTARHHNFGSGTGDASCKVRFGVAKAAVIYLVRSGTFEGGSRNVDTWLEIGGFEELVCLQVQRHPVLDPKSGTLTRNRKLLKEILRPALELQREIEGFEAAVFRFSSGTD